MSTLETQSVDTSAPSVARSTLIVMMGLGASIVSGIVRQRLVATRFGTGAELDAYTAANGIPELLFTILAGGALGFAFIPIYTEALRSESSGSARSLFSSVLNLILILTCIAAIIVATFAPTLVSAPWGIGPDFTPDVQALVWELMRVLLFSTVIFAASSILTGALHAHQHFLLPALAPVIYSVGIIFGVLFLTPSLGVVGLAWGAVGGSVLHLLIQLPAAFRYRVQWAPIIDFRDPALLRVGYLMAPRVVDLFMARLSIDWINSNIGSGLEEGRLSAVRFAYQLMNMPWTLIGTAIGIAVFPTFAVLAARTNRDAQRDALSGALRAIFTLAIPAAVALLVLGVPIIQVLYEGGEFTPESTRLVYFALQFYALTLISVSMLEVVVRAFAADKDTLTPLIVSFFTTALNFFLAFRLSRAIADGGLEHGGLALANGIAVGIESVIGLTILHFRWRGINASHIILDVVKALIAAALMGGLIIAIQHYWNWGVLPGLLVSATVGAAVYFGVAYALGIKEILTIPQSLFGHFLGVPVPSSGDDGV